MKTTHIFVPALDVGEILPFTVRKQKSLAETFQEQDRAKQELVKFVDTLEKHFNEPIHYMGMDIIGEKSYERFIFEKGGFFEVMVEPPIAMNAHFVHKKRASQFKDALKKTLVQMLGKTTVSELFINSIQTQSEKDQSLRVQDWKKIKEIRDKK